ncbi:uncharacterized protein CIMG_13462 [Coccidioides immitis RS]|uniref:Uncharacterized protein n=1 Tax=Coccidioides immitis (strain RS) TaxID=246410 RepID=A0A0E1RXN9_COCIM|nr:uncharacterized protein CIMG_13462 [Coccidioides immitis RS]EAS34344.2 hypothetical protein CIMG_13462 [Coccidioides immitis RS]
MGYENETTSCLNGQWSKIGYWIGWTANQMGGNRSFSSLNWATTKESRSKTRCAVAHCFPAPERAPVADMQANNPRSYGESKQKSIETKRHPASRISHLRFTRRSHRAAAPDHPLDRWWDSGQRGHPQSTLVRVGSESPRSSSPVILRFPHFEGGEPHSHP